MRKPYEPRRPVSRVRDMNTPEPCHVLIKMVKRGPHVAARIFWCDHEPGFPDNKLDRWPVPFLAAEIDGRPAAVERVWHAVWEQKITESEYRFRVADSEHAKRWRPNEAIAQPTKPVDLRSLPIPFAED